MAASRVIKIGTLLCVCIGRSVIADTPRICELAAKRGALGEFQVRVDPDQDGNRIVIADVDGDGSGDELKWFARDPGTTISADNSTVTLTLASNNKSFSLAQQQLQVVKLESNYFVVTTRVVSGLGPWEREVYAVTQKGFTKTCSFAGKGQAP